MDMTQRLLLNPIPRAMVQRIPGTHTCARIPRHGVNASVDNWKGEGPFVH